MSITFTSTMAGASSDYLKYLWDKAKKTDRYQDSTLLDFALIPYDSSFVKLARGAYIKLNSAKYPNWFTGYINNEPELVYLGVKNKTKMYGYRYQATSDEYILSLKPIGLVPTFYNMTMGAILKTLANQLVPGTFDLSGIKNGPLVAQYTVDPSRKFYDIAKEFCNAASFVFYGNNMKLYFDAQDHISPAITLDANDKNFTPSNLQLKADTSPILNDVTCLGEIEGQAYITEYFVGTGLDASFSLIDGPFGADTCVLLDDDFSSASISTDNWIVNDNASNYLQVSNGYLNCLGGSQNQSYDISLESAYPIPMEGKLRLTHGEWDFLAGQGIIGGCWTQAPNQSYTGCLYALSVANLTINPIVGGSFDNNQSAPIDTTKRYVLRTIAEFNKLNRTSQTYSYLDQNGAVQTLKGAASGDTVVWSTIITEVDPNTGQITNQWNFRNTGTLSGTGDSYANYYPVASNDLHATFTGVTLSIPINAALETASLAQFTNLNFDNWVDTNTPTGWINPVGVTEETTVVDSGNCAKLTAANSTPASVQQDATSVISANTPYNIGVRLRRAANTAGTLKIVLSGTGMSETGISIDMHAPVPIDKFGYFSGVLTTGLATIPTDLVLSIYYQDAPDGSSVYVDNISILSGWQAQLVGPNEMDAMDGLAPIATIVSTNQNSQTRNTYTNAPQYNPGQSTLVFFKDSVTRTSDIPPQGQVVRLAYRAAGAAIGRAINRSSINTEAVNWGDDGVRSIIRNDLSPRPRTSAECELAAAALVAENSFTHYTGQYVQFSSYFTDEPRAGAIFKLINLTNVSIHAEEISEVVTTLESKSPVELFQHTITFGKPDHIRRFLSKVGSPVGTYQSPNVVPVVPAIDVAAVGTLYAPDVTKPSVIGWDDGNVYVDAGQDLPTGGSFEVRYTDQSWGVDDSKNLVLRSMSRNFSVVRGERGRVFFIRQVNPGNCLQWSEDLTNSKYTPSGAMVSNSYGKNPDYDTSLVSSVAFSANGYISQTFTPAVSGTGAAFSFSIKGPAGATFTATVAGSTALTCKTTGYWQRFTVPCSASLSNGTFYTASVTSQSAVTAQLTRWSVECGVQAETLYARTTDKLYGPTSRYSSGINASFPSPSGSSDVSSILVTPSF